MKKKTPPAYVNESSQQQQFSRSLVSYCSRTQSSMSRLTTKCFFK